MPNSAFDHFHSQRLCYLGSEKLVYSTGEGPLVILLHEAPGPIPETFDLGLRLSKQGFRVFIPVFFGTPREQPKVMVINQKHPDTPGAGQTLKSRSRPLPTHPRMEYFRKGNSRC